MQVWGGLGAVGAASIALLQKHLRPATGILLSQHTEVREGNFQDTFVVLYGNNLMRRLHQLLFLPFILLAPVGCHQKDDSNPSAPESASSVSLGWPSVDLPPDSPVCRVGLPKDFKSETMNQPQLQMQMFYYEADTHQVALSIMQNSLRNWTPSEQDKLLIGARDGAIGMVGGKIVQQTEVTVGQGRGMDCDVRCTAEGKEMRILMRLVAAEPYMFQVQWVQELKDFNVDLARQFVDSFEVIPAPTGAQNGSSQPASAPKAPR